MIRKFSLKLFISVAIVAIGFNGICFRAFSGQNPLHVPMAKAMPMVMEVNPDCMVQNSLGTNMNCCFSSSHANETKSIVAAKTEENSKKLVHDPDFLLTSFLGSFDQKEREKLFYKPSSSHRVHQTLTGIVVKKE